MKKITLLILLLFFSHAGFSQWSENFDGAPAAPAAGGVWTLPSGDWHIINNGVGTAFWRLNTVAWPAYSLPNAAFINTSNIGQGNTSIDYLATPLKPIPANGQLRFQSRMTVAGNQGTIFEIRAAAAGSDPTLMASYSTLIATFTEDDLSVPSSIATYIEKVVPLPASLGANAYLAFVRKFTQPTAALSGDRWLVDDVRVVQKCLDPTTLTAGSIGLTSASLNWANPSGSTEWEIEIMPFTATPTGTGVLINQRPFTATQITVGNAFGPALLPGTQYKYRVRSVCTGNVTSDWSPTFAFATTSPGLTCNSPIIIGSTPYSTTDNTANYADDYDVSQPVGCADAGLNYMTGNDVFYSYTPTVSGNINIKMTPTGSRTGIFVYQGCANVGVACLAGVGNTGNTVREIPSLAVTAGVEYIIVISSSAAPQTFAYTLVIQTLNCAPPTGLSATGTGPNSANLSWDAGVASSWEVFVQTAGAQVPTGAGTTTTVNSNYAVTTTTAGAGLVLGTPYQYWVRASCGDGTFSPWTGPYLFNTTSCASGCNYTFTMTDTVGDSWNGNTMNVVQNGITLAVLTGPTNAQGTSPVTVSVPLCDGPFTLFWNAGGSWPAEVGVSITNSFGQIIYTKLPGIGSVNTLLYTGNVDCSTPACLSPLNLTVTNVTMDSATLGWTSNGPAIGTYQYIVVAANAPDPAPNDPNWQTGTSPQPISGLLSGTNYKFYVRAVCSPTSTSTAAGPRTFSTTQIPAILPMNETFEGTINWSTSSAGQTNQWVVGTATSNGGTHALYISNDGGVANAYNITATSVSHAYRDIQIPAVVNEINLSFDWRNNGESCCDYFRVWLVPSNFSPVAGTQITAAASGGIQIGANNNLSAGYQTSNYVIPAAAFAGQIRRLIFEWRNDGSVGTQPPAAIDNVVMNLITCSAPTAVVANTFTQTGATVTWTAPVNGAQSYDYYYSTTNTAPTAGATPNGNVVGTTLNLSGLSPSTTYYIWIRSNCGAVDGTSTWSGPATILTTQIPATLTFTETFEGTPQWSLSNGTQANKWVIGTATSNGGTHSLYITENTGTTNTYNIGSTSVVHAFRDIQFPAAVNDISLSFDWRNVGESCCDYFRVWLVPTSFVPVPGTQIAAAAGIVQIGANNNLSPGYQTANYIIPAAAYAGQVRRLIFEWRNDGSVGTQPPAAIDNIVMSVITCSAPTNIVVNTVNQTSATVSWTGPATGAQSYDYYYSTSNTPPTAATTPNGNSVPSTTQVTGLTHSTTYYFWVRTNCGAVDGVSTWSGPATIVTTQIPGTLNFVDTFEGNAEWSVLNGSQTNKWIIGTAVSNGGTKSLYITNNNGLTNSYTTSSTSVVHAYRDVQMPAAIGDLFLSFDWKAVGEGTSFKFDYFRVWMVPATFVPTPGTQIVAGPGRLQIAGDFNNSSTWQTENILFSASQYSGQVMRMVFEWKNDSSGGTQPPAAIDNVMLTQLTCPAPIFLTASSTSVENNIALTWTPVGQETQWEVFVQVSGGPLPTTGTIVNQTSFTYSAIPGTFYQFWVRAVCGPGDNSFWAGPENFSIYAPPGCAAVDLVGVGVDIVDAEIFLCAGESQCVNLEASFYGIGATNTYEVSSIDYNPPFPFTGGTEMNINTDDIWSPVINLPFNFCFFGNVYSSAQVGSNGLISFNPQTAPGFCEWNLGGLQIPNTGFVQKNAIYGVYQDINPATTNPSGPKSINYQVLGTYPCRALVVNFSNMLQFSCGTATGNQTSQIVIYEISNIIEVYVERRVPCMAWPSSSAQAGQGLIGIQNSAGTQAYAPPGRNTGAWTATNEAWRFAPNGASNVEFQWLKDGVFFSNDQNIEVCITGDTNMVAEATYIACDGTEIVTSSEVLIKTTSPLPTNEPVTILSCSATGNAIFDLTPNNAVILTGVSDPNFVITYHLTEAEALAGTGAILDITQVPGVPGQIIWVRIAYGQTQCFEVKSFDLQLGENTPAVTEFSYNSPVCINTVTTPTPIPVTGFTIGGTYSSTPGLAINPATGEIDLTNSTAGGYDVTYTVTPNNCNDGGSFTAPITITPVDVVTAPASETVCNEYVLPALSAGNYYTQPGGQGDMLHADDVITETTTLYVYSANGDCSSQESFEITVNTAVADAPANVVECTSYTLPALSVNNAYYTEPGGPTGAGVEIPVGTVYDTVGTTTTVHVYAENGACFDQNSFTITIAGAVTADILQPVEACNEYELQPLSPNNYYFTGPNGTGTPLFAGDMVTTPGINTIHIRAVAGDCTDESIFAVTINQTPIVAQMGTVQACDSYLLPTLAVGDYYTAPDGPNGTGVLVNPNDPITQSTMLWIYAQTNTTPNCSAESSFEIVITPTPAVTPVAQVDACQSYTLPAIVGNGAYFSQPNGQGAMQVGDVLTSSQMVYVFAQTGVCSSEQSFMVNIGAVPEFNITGICENDVYTLRANVLGESYDPQAVGYSWTTSNGNILSSTDASFVKIDGPGTYTLTISTPGCPDVVQSLEVTATQCMIQKGISPNGDGLNDCFKLNSFNVEHLSIFNRYGMKVYERANYKDEWCGQSDKGDELPDGTYYYVIKRASEAATTGWIYINRKN